MSKLRDSQISSFDPSQSEMDAHQKKFALSEDEAAALLPDLHEDPQKIVDREKEMDVHAAKLDFSEEETANFHEQYTANLTEEMKKDEAIAHQRKVIESMKNMEVVSGTKNTTVHVEMSLPSKAKNSIELPDQVLNEEFEAAEQAKLDKKIAKAGYDKATETGTIKKGLWRRLVEGMGTGLGKTLDVGEKTIFQGKTVKDPDIQNSWDEKAVAMDSMTDDQARKENEALDAEQTAQLLQTAEALGYDQETVKKGKPRRIVEGIGTGLDNTLQVGEKAIFQGKTIALPEENNAPIPQKKPSLWNRMLGRK